MRHGPHPRCPTLRGHGRPCTADDHAKTRFRREGTSLLVGGTLTRGYISKFHVLPPFVFDQACPGALLTCPQALRLSEIFLGFWESRAAQPSPMPRPASPRRGPLFRTIPKKFFPVVERLWARWATADTPARSDTAQLSKRAEGNHALVRLQESAELLGDCPRTAAVSTATCERGAI